MKTNKTKPIKKIMIFTIITVMIVSLFAVPAFADVQWDAVSGNLTPITLNPTSLSDSVNTEGYYCISIDADDIKSAIISMIGSFGTGINFNIFGAIANNRALYNNGYIRLYYFDGGWIDYRNYYDNGNDSYYTTISHNGGTDVTSIGCPSQSGLTVYDIDAFTKIDIIIPEYPILNALGSPQADAFWNNVVYSVYQYSNATPDPDDPTPPADGEEQGIFAVWSQITQWIVEGLASVSNAFYANGELTLLGYLCIIPLAIGVAFLLIAIIQKFLRLRG